MPHYAFVPGQIGEAEGRSFRNFYPRQVRGLIVGVAGGLAGALLLGAATAWRCFLIFGLAVPGFAYGFFMPGGKPIEYWARVLLTFYLGSQRIVRHAGGPQPAKTKEDHKFGRERRHR